MWSGTLATIPANWSLCDGTGGTPNLVARFLRGAPAATNPGTTGGSDTHTHASMTAAGSHTHTAQAGGSHSHVVNSAGAHSHTSIPAVSAGAAMTYAGAWAGDHTHTTNASATHTHTMDSSANHTHTIGAVDGRPPYYEVAFIQAGAGALVAVGLILIWAGTLASIPAGWSLCDGGDSRPDLRTRFVRGVNTSVTNPGGLGGNTTHTHALTNDIVHSHTMNAGGTHNHTHNAYTWTHSHNVTNTASGAHSACIQLDSGGGNHTHANTDSIGSHSHALGNSTHLASAHIVNTASSLPVYYDVAYIINVSAAVVPTNGILIWTGLLANIPSEYNLCDGGGGRPELRGKFLRGAAAGVDPGGEGGSDTHTHGETGNAGAHSDHSVGSAGAHTHAATDSIGGHTHDWDLVFPGQYVNSSYNVGLTDGAHSHTFNSGGAHVNHTLTSSGDHNHQPWSTDTIRPAYYEVAFIMKI